MTLGGHLSRPSYDYVYRHLYFEVIDPTAIVLSLTYTDTMPKMLDDHGKSKPGRLTRYRCIHIERKHEIMQSRISWVLEKEVGEYEYHTVVVHRRMTVVALEIITMNE
jgi:hypothetical protein